MLALIQSIRHLRCTWLLLATFCCELAWAAPLRVRGTPTFRAIRTQPTADGGYQVIGYVRDTFDQPLSGISVELEGAAGHPCEPATNISGPDGEFCFRVAATTGTRVGVAVAGTEFLDPARLDVQLDPSRAHFSLKVSVDDAEFDLSRPEHRVVVSLDAKVPSRETYPVRLRLLDAKSGSATRVERTLAVSASRNAEFTLDSAQLGAPGPALLRAEVSITNQVLAQAQHEVTIVDTVTLEFAEDVGSVRPATGFEVAISANGLSGAVNSGWVEATVGETSVGQAPVRGGRADLDLRFQAPRQEEIPMTIRYLPQEPYHRAGAPLTHSLRILPPPWWAQAPWIALAAFAAFWIVRAWRRPGRQEAAGPRPLAGQGKAEALLKRRLPDADAWSGLVIDAHSREPVSGAELRIDVPTVEKVLVAVRSTSGPDGAFRLDKVKRLPEGARLVVNSKNHSELKQPVPPLGELQVAIVERRRKLLADLTRWAKSMGRPWAGAEDPTPAQVARVAQLQGRDETSLWARELESAAYSREGPSEQVEVELTSRTPPLDRLDPHKR